MRNRNSHVKARSGDSPPPPAQPLDERLFADQRLGVLFALWLVGRSTVGAIEARIGATGLAADEYAVYCLLDMAGPLTPSALGAWMAAPPTTVSAFVKRLERRGHVVRRPNPDDGRSHLLELTAEGRNARAAASAAMAPFSDRVRRDLGASADTFIDELLALRRILDAAQGAGGGDS
jgi:DNA-binding MarR family transcriptional regulator